MINCLKLCLKINNNNNNGNILMRLIQRNFFKIVINIHSYNVRVYIIIIQIDDFQKRSLKKLHSTYFYKTLKQKKFNI